MKSIMLHKRGLLASSARPKAGIKKIFIPEDY